MIHSSKALAVVLGSLLTLTACSGSSDVDVNDEIQGASADPAAAASAASTTPPSALDGGVDATTDPPLVKHCNATVAEPDTCIENTQGHAGDVVDVDIVLVGNPTCGDAWEAGGRIVFDLAKLHVENEVEQVACRTRHIGPDVNGVDNLRWNAFGGGSLAGCAANVPLGKADTIKLKIAAGTPPGEYPLTWQDAGFIANANAPQQCSTLGHGIAGKLRVLP
jgi:hypothetical protein